MDYSLLLAIHNVDEAAREKREVTKVVTLPKAFGLSYSVFF